MTVERGNRKANECDTTSCNQLSSPERRGAEYAVVQLGRFVEHHFLRFGDIITRNASASNAAAMMERGEAEV